MENEKQEKQESPQNQEPQKLIRYMRLCVLLLTGLFVVACAATVLLVPRAVQMLDRLDATLTSVDTLVGTADAALNSANQAADTANRLVADNADAVAEAMEKFNSVDFAALNRAINDLADIVEPLAKVTNFLAK